MYEKIRRSEKFLVFLTRHYVTQHPKRNNENNYTLLMKILTSNPKAVAMAVASAALLVMTGCVDNRYDLDNISTEVTVGGDEVIIPLGKVNEKSLEELIGSDIENLECIDGVYTFRFGDEGSISVDELSVPTIDNISPKIEPVTFKSPAMPSTFAFSAINDTFTVNYPDLGTAPVIDRIDETVEFNSRISLPSGNIPALGQQTISINGQTAFSAEFDIPSEISGLGKLYLGEAGSDYGSPFDITLSLNGLKSINGGGTLSIKAQFPSNYTVLDASGKDIGSTYTVNNHKINAGDDGVSFRVYIKSVDLTNATAPDGKLVLKDKIDFSFTLDFNAVAGYYNSALKPAFTMTCKPVYKDIEIVTGSIAVDSESHVNDIVYSFNGIPEGIKSIDKIVFTSAPFKLSVKGLEWMKDGLLNATIQLPKEFTFDSNSKLNASTNTLTASVSELGKGISLNLKSIDCSKGNVVIANGQVTVKAQISAKMSDIAAGQKLMLSEIKPESTPVTVTTSVEGASMTLDTKQTTVSVNQQTYSFDFGADNAPRLQQTIELPKEITAIKSLTLAKKGSTAKPQAALSLNVPNNSSFPVDNVTLDFTVNLGQMIHPVEGQQNISRADNGDWLFTVHNRTWSPKTQSTLNLATIAFDSIENIPALNEEGKLVLDEAFAVSGGITVADGSNIDLTSGNITIGFDFKIDDIQVTEFAGTVDYNLSPEQIEVDLADIADFGLDIDNLALSPIIGFNITNPVGIPFTADIVLTPYDDNEKPIEANVVALKGIEIAGNGLSDIVIAAEERSSHYGPDVTFVPADITKLLSGQIPAKLTVDFNVHSDTSVLHTIDLTKSSYTIDYGYDIAIPFEFGKGLDIYYSDTVENLGDAFAEAADIGVKIKEIGIVADFYTSIPLDLVLDAQLLDADGNEAPVKIDLGSNGVIHGHNPESKSKTTKSTIMMMLVLGDDGNLEHLKEVDALRFSVNLRNSGYDECALKPEQTISGVLKLQINGGVTFDPDKL